MRIALIACANGLGHVRRMLALSLALRDQGAYPIIFAPRRAVNHLSLIYGVPSPEVVNFESRTTRADWLASDNECWIDNLPSLDAFEEVISDNLIEVLARRPDAWLSGTFFWHRALSNFPSQKAQQSEQLLSQCCPRVIASGLFAPPYLAEKSRVFSVGLYTFGGVNVGTGLSDLLVSCGKGGQVFSDSKALVERVASGPRPGPFTVWVEPVLYRDQMPGWIQPAVFTPAMYGRLAAAVIRPGIGTLTDCLFAGARVFLFHEADNLEMANNAHRVRDNDLGDVFLKIDDCYTAALEYIKKINSNSGKDGQSKDIDFGGAEQAARLLLGGRI